MDDALFTFCVPYDVGNRAHTLPSARSRCVCVLCEKGLAFSEQTLLVSFSFRRDPEPHPLNRPNDTQRPQTATNELHDTHNPDANMDTGTPLRCSTGSPLCSEEQFAAVRFVVCGFVDVCIWSIISPFVQPQCRRQAEHTSTLM